MTTVNSIFASNDVQVKSSKVVETVARTVRMVHYPDGRQTLQGAYAWTQGFKGGIEWKDLPLIPVDSNGQEFTSD